MRRAPLLTLLLLPLALACTTVTDDMANPQVREPALETPIMVSKSDLARAAANFEVRAIELLPGETPEQALARVVGPAAPSLGALLDSAAPVEGLGPAPEAAEAPARCDDSCAFAYNHICDDGSAGAATSRCAAGTDCADCQGQAGPEAAPQPGGESPEPEPAPEPAPEPGAEPQPALSPAPTANRCDDTCNYAFDGECDDGRAGAATGLCAAGSDCTDCEGAVAAQAAAPAPAADPQAADPAPAEPAPAAPAPAAQGGQTCMANGLDGTCGPTAQCGGRSVPGFCPGPADIQCCVPDVAAGAADHPAVGQGCNAAGEPGTCQHTGDCGGESVPGYCAGPADIQCCVGTRRAQVAPVVYGGYLLLQWGARRLIFAAVRTGVQRAGVHVATVRVASAARGVSQVGVYINAEEAAMGAGLTAATATVLGGPVGQELMDFLAERRASPEVEARWAGVAAEPMEPPGTCEPDEYEGYRQRKEDACGPTQACRGNNWVSQMTEEILDAYTSGGSLARYHNVIGQVTGYCDDLRQNHAQALECFRRRQDIMDACFEGGDARHWEALNQVDNLRLNCERQYANHNCQHFQEGSPLLP